MNQVFLQHYIETQLNKLGLTKESDINFVFFWKPKTKVRGVIDEACCCQWWRAPVKYKGTVFATAEHAMMFSKAKMFNDKIAMAAILEEPHPWTVKTIGRQVQNFVKSQWEDEGIKIVRDINFEKFKQDPRLYKWISQFPKNTLFVEASPLDNEWGIYLENTGKQDLTNFKIWQGKNKLGFAITDAFQELMGYK